MTHEIATAQPLDSINWLKSGWALFLKSWRPWLIAMVGLAVANFVLGFIPILGALLTMALNLLAAVAAMIALRSFDTTGTVDWQAVQDRAKARVTPVGILVAINIGILLIATVGAGGALAGAMGSNKAMLGIGTVIGFAAFATSLLVNYFAVPLISLSEVSAPDAVKLSVQACVKNLPALAIFSVIGAVLFFIAALPAGLGLLVLFPVMVSAVYYATRQIFPTV